MKKIYRPLVFMLCAVMMSGCFGAPPAPADTETQTSVQTESPVTETAAPVSVSAAALDGEEEPSHSVNAPADKPLVISADGIPGAYTPFTGSSDIDEIISAVTGVTLLGKTRSGSVVMNGVTGETEEYHGIPYEYGGIADTTVTADEEAGTSTYTFNLRTDIRFADGELLDADDVIFSLYAALDNSADMNPLKTAGIKGALNYRFNSPIAEDITDEQITEVLSSDELAEVFRDRLYIPVLTEQYESVLSLYKDDSQDIYTSTYPDPDDLFVFFYAADSSYKKPENTVKDAVIRDVAEGYGTNYRQFAGRVVGDERMFDEFAEFAAIEYITKQQAEDGIPEEVTDISGIKKTGKFSVSITVSGNGRKLEDALCGLVIAPLHYYGNEEMYDYAAGKFGFVRGNAADLYADDLPAAHRGEPMGAGAYTFSESADGALILKASENYYGEAPLTPSLKLIGAGDPTALISDGEADIAFAVSGTALTERIDEANRTIRKIDSVRLGGRGYGAVILNADTVNVAGEPYSEASVSLRKAIATAISAYRADSVGDYFGGYFAFTDYPCIDNVTIPVESENYTVPYSTDRNGDPINTGDMSDEAYAGAVKTACLGFLEDAGYTMIEDGKAEAPEGGRTTFAAELSTAGTGAHPSLDALNRASELLADIGITLNVTDISDVGVLYENISSQTYDLAAISVIGSLSSAYDRLSAMPGLKEKIAEAAEVPVGEIPEAYLAVYDKVINEYAAEIPMYERSVELLYSALRVDGEAFGQGITPQYGWTHFIGSIKLK